MDFRQVVKPASEASNATILRQAAERLIDRRAVTKLEQVLRREHPTGSLPLGPRENLVRNRIHIGQKKYTILLTTIPARLSLEMAEAPYYLGARAA